MKIFLIRHGEQLYPYDEQGRKLVSNPDAPLAELGRIQMIQLREKLAQEGQTIDVFYRSPYKRTKQSAEILAEGQSVPIHVVDELKEIFPNSAEGHTYYELEAIGGDIYAHPFSPDQETLDNFINRSREAIKFIFADVREKGYTSLGIVGHGDSICALDWSLKHPNPPASYAEMRDAFYPQKGQAVEYTLDPNLKLVGEGRIITTEAAKQTIEDFRSSRQTEVE